MLQANSQDIAPLGAFFINHAGGGNDEAGRKLL